ncbi:MAG TPA: LPXTG cell wall anchor domain-containing protein [Dehalococcoidia bacterium]|jgi:LPXTG-motif cell wall-anchored protein|nr:LPXTG cell wall anchor domain-containing protein [Dehalococcoidia bacterium]
MPEIALIVALHGAHAGGVDGGWIGSLVIGVLIIAGLALLSRKRRP